MAHVFKIVQKKFQIAPDGSNDTLIYNEEFISQPYATPQERNTAAILKNNEIVIVNPPNVCEVRVLYTGTGTNGNYIFRDKFSSFGCGVHHDGNSPFAEQVNYRYKVILQRESLLYNATVV